MLNKPKPSAAKIRLTSLDIAATKRAQLQALLPEVFNEGKIDYEQLKCVLGEAADEQADKGRFGLNWAGKGDCLKIIKSPSIATLKPCPDESVNFDETENLFIEGDNLEVLKLLQKSYFGKVKMIYIDPPYNTGKEFIYPDQYSESLDAYLHYTGQKDSEGRKFSTNAETEGRYHSRWLNMMYPRLYLAKNLLREDGVILISIDDHEQANLKKLCDEIFGEENFVACFNWTTKSGAQGMQTQTMVVTNHEYIMCYAKNIDHFKFYGQARTQEGFSNPDDDPRGAWKRQYLQRIGQSLPRRTLKNPENGMEFVFETPYTQAKLDHWILEGRIIFPKSPDQYPARKEFLSEYKTPKQLVTHLGLYATKATTEKLYNLFDGKKIFTNPKPNTILQYLIKTCFQPDQNDIILDFFAGSGTTAHAVMQLNAEDGGQRKFICIQLPEPCAAKSEAAKAGYKTICDIGKERIRRAANSIAAGRDLNDAVKLDLGFKVLKLAPSNFKRCADKARLAAQLELSSDYIQADSTAVAILYELLLKMGYSLTVPIETLTLAGKAVFAIDGGSLLICLDKTLDQAVIDAMIKRKPLQVVCLDAGFQGNDALKVNAVQACKSRNQQVGDEITFRVV